MNVQSVKQRFGIIGRTPALDRALSTAIRVAPTELTVLITGPSGVGKEAFSKIIHSLSPRKHNSFIAINCGAIPSGTINSELFGHEKGAFTGATSDRKGYFETVNGGTIFLDEISEMPLDTQAFLLRVLESGEFIKVGSSKVQKTDVRIIAATNKDLMQQIQNGKFREDLYYRLNTVPIYVPALKERREDIYMLFRKFAIDFAEKYRTEPVELDDEARYLIENYEWPGNVRQLKNMVEQLSVLSQESRITSQQLLDFAPHLSQRNLPAIPASPEARSSFEEREILYKLLFDMKSDLQELKTTVFGLIQNNDLQLMNEGEMENLRLSLSESGGRIQRDGWEGRPEIHRNQEYKIEKPAESEQVREFDYDESVETEEDLSLEHMEREMITKALDKHHGRRKDAAKDLGISERTLYRKIKEYEL